MTGYIPHIHLDNISIFIVFILTGPQHYLNIFLANNRIINIPIKIIIPANIIAKFIPKGLNQDSFGEIINIFPRAIDKKILKVLINIIGISFKFMDTIPARTINKKAPKNARVDPLAGIEVSR